MLITRNDIQRIGDEDTFMHFLQEKLNLPIPESVPLAQIAIPLPLAFLGLEESIAEHIIDCQEFRGLLKDGLDVREPFLIRFRREEKYPEILRYIAEGLSQKNINPAEIFFICTDENFQPFALAHFNDSGTKDWNSEVLNIFRWTQGNTCINTGSKYDLSVLFSSEEESATESDSSPEVGKTFSDCIGKSHSSEDLLIKLQNMGTPLSQHLKQYGNIHTGITPGYTRAFVIDEFKRQELIDEDRKNIELIREFLKPREWTGESAYLICIPSSRDKRWPWSGISDESGAEQIFETTYPAISAHMKNYRDKLEGRECFKKTRSAVFYWELPSYGFYSMLERPKIFYPPVTSSMKAAYDTSEKLLLSAAFFPTTDLSLLATLNSKLFAWYIEKKCRSPQYNNLVLKKENMSKVPIVRRTEEQIEKFSDLVQQILDDPNSLEVPDIEQKIDELVYKLYELTEAEITLIEEESNL